MLPSTMWRYLVLAVMVTTTAHGQYGPAPAAAPGQAPPITDIDILNFALNLECLEAQFYSYATTGMGLTDADRGYGPPPIGGQKALLSAEGQAYAQEIAADEIRHVQFLRAALGPAAVPCPLIDIGSAFAEAFNEAFGTTLPAPPFSPYANDIFFLHGAFIFEDVGVTGYHGAIPLILNKDYLSAAAGIEAVEGYHASEIRTRLFQNATYVIPQYALPVATIIQKISDLRNALGGRGLDQGIVNPQGGPIIVPTDANAIVFSRTPAQVLAIVYLGGASNGGFFPQGINGNLK